MENSSTDVRNLRSVLHHPVGLPLIRYLHSKTAGKEKGTGGGDDEAKEEVEEEFPLIKEYFPDFFEGGGGGAATAASAEVAAAAAAAADGGPAAASAGVGAGAGGADPPCATAKRLLRLLRRLLRLLRPFPSTTSFTFATLGGATARVRRSASLTSLPRTLPRNWGLR
jgi:hypothetical protein